MCKLAFGAIAIACAVSAPVLVNASSAEAAVKTSAVAKCASWFASFRAEIKERIFIHYNYTRTRDGLAATSAADYNTAWLRVTPTDLRRNATYLKTSIDEGHPQIAFLQKLGFKFDFENGHTIPTMSEISARYDELAKDLITRGKVREEDLIRPARMFQVIENGKRRIIAVGLTQEPPAGALPLNDVVRGEEFLRFLADGYWPIGEIMPGGDTGISFALHDLGHVGAFARNPDYMRALKDFARTRVAAGRFDIKDNKMNAILESLALGRADLRPQFDETLSKLGILNRNASEPWTASNFATALEGFSDGKISEEILAAYKQRHGLIEDFGGARSDAFTVPRSKNPRLESFEEWPDNPKSILENAFHATDPRMKRVAYAKYLAAMDHSTRISPADFLKELTHKDNLTLDSKIYRYLCVSGIFQSKSRFYTRFCRLSGP